MLIPYTVIAGKAIKRLAALRGGGSALPGLMMERIDRDFLQRTLEQLPHGVVVISGTNGKTTTTKMVVELLEGQGMKVFTNRTGSNFTRGVAAALLSAVDHRGKLDADIAVLELDEAHAVHFVKLIQPRFSLFLNVMRDQLDRFGEIDTTANLLKKIAQATTDGVVINRDDARLVSPAFTSEIRAPLIRRFGVSDELISQFPDDDSMRRGASAKNLADEPDDTVLERFEQQNATITFNSKAHDVELQLKGIYNVQNAVGALALVRLILQDELNLMALMRSLSNVTPAFGRGETITIHGEPCEIVLVKNPSGFRLSLESFKPAGIATMIAINDNYADGRDMSWLWDVEFDDLQTEGVRMVSGSRAYEMALRLQYDEVAVSKIEPGLTKALREFIRKNPGPKRIFTTYTAMLAIRRELAKITTVDEVRA